VPLLDMDACLFAVQEVMGLVILLRCIMGFKIPMGSYFDPLVFRLPRGGGLTYNPTPCPHF